MIAYNDVHGGGEPVTTGKGCQRLATYRGDLASAIEYAIDRYGEAVLGPTDAAICTAALRFYALMHAAPAPATPTIAVLSTAMEASS